MILCDWLETFIEDNQWEGSPSVKKDFLIKSWDELGNDSIKSGWGALSYTITYLCIC